MTVGLAAGVLGIGLADGSGVRGDGPTVLVLGLVGEAGLEGGRGQGQTVGRERGA